MALVRCIDIESTALQDGEAIEVGWVDLETQTGEIAPAGYSELCRVSSNPSETRAIHHIRMEMVAGCPPYDRRVVYERAVQAGVTAWVGHNTGLEEQYLPNGLPIICTYKAALRLWPDAPGTHSLFAVLYHLEDLGLIEVDPARAAPQHRALPDAYACALIMQAAISLGVTGRELMDWSSLPRVLPRCPIGKYRQQPWANCDTGFLEWIMRTIYDDPDIRWNAQQELNRRMDDDDRLY